MYHSDNGVLIYKTLREMDSSEVSKQRITELFSIIRENNGLKVYNHIKKDLVKTKRYNFSHFLLLCPTPPQPIISPDYAK